MLATPDLCISVAPAVQTEIEARNYPVPDQPSFPTPSAFAQDSTWNILPTPYQDVFPSDFIGTQVDLNLSTFPGNDHLQNQEIIGHPGIQGPHTAWEPNEMRIDSRAPSGSFASDVLDNTQPEDLAFEPNGDMEYDHTCPQGTVRPSDLDLLGRSCIDPTSASFNDFLFPMIQDRRLPRDGRNMEVIPSPPVSLASVSAWKAKE
ncbi:hypothetical protein QQX98_004375 [Neonectria punicea]|uniref:Uncharacterized protein n=1 Tax=Neonectria punicea TaxID=979145 RepID=A0ABR1H9J1_9HYPO